MLLYTILNF